MAGLDSIQSLLQEKGRLVAPSATRWLSVKRCVKRLKTCFSSVVITLEKEGTERGEAKAIGLYCLVSEYVFVCTLLLMCDALPRVQTISVSKLQTAITVSSLEWCHVQLNHLSS